MAIYWKTEGDLDFKKRFKKWFKKFHKLMKEGRIYKVMRKVGLMK
jgi:hypothetical protein